MIDLTNKCVLVRTHEEYENILKAAKKQGYIGIRSVASIL
jgi:hypothetical protein